MLYVISRWFDEALWLPASEATLAKMREMVRGEPWRIGL